MKWRHAAYIAVLQLGTGFFLGTWFIIGFANHLTVNTTAPEKCRSTYYRADNSKDFFHIYICR